MDPGSSSIITTIKRSIQTVGNNETTPRGLLIISILLYCIVFSYITLLRHWSFYSTYFDLGCFEQGLWTTLHGLFFWNSPHDASQFGVHNSPILFIMLPIYYLFPYAETLILFQTVLLAIAAIPLYYIGKHYLKAWGGLTFALIYLLYPALHGMNLFDFHEMAFIPLILFSALYFLITNRLYYFVILSIVALLIKEDVSLLLIMLTAYAVYTKRYETEAQKKLLCLLMVIYAGWLLLSLMVVIPYFNPHGYLFSSRYATDGGVLFYVTNNLALKIVYLILLSAPLGCTPLAAPEFLATALPSFAEILFQSNVAYRITTQYSALVIPVLFTSAIMGTGRIIRWLDMKRPSLKRLVLPVLLLLGLVSCIFCTPAPVSPFTLYYKFSPNSCQYTIDEHTRYLQDAIAMIPRVPLFLHRTTLQVTCHAVQNCTWITAPGCSIF